MVDKDALRGLAEQLRHFCAGVSTVDEFEKRTEFAESRSADQALFRIWHLAWCCYDDFRTTRLRGEWQLTRENRRVFAICILFLQIERELEWPDYWFGRMTPINSIINCLTTGWVAHRLEVEVDRRRRDFGDYEVWPFRYRWDLEQAVKNPILVAGDKRRVQ